MRVRRRLVIAFAALVVAGVACGTPSSGPAGPSAVPSGAEQPACHLPVALQPLAADSRYEDRLILGFVELPSGSVEWESADATGTLPYTGRAAYDWVSGAWAPVDPGSLAPPGGAYAYARGVAYDEANHWTDTTVDVVDLRTGADRVIVGSGHLQVAGWVPAGILVIPVVQGGPLPGLFLVDPNSSTVRRLDVDLDFQPGYWRVADGAAWTGTIDASDPNFRPVGPGSANELVRLDPATGRTEVAYRSPGHQVSVMGGAGGGGVLVLEEDYVQSSSRVLLLRAGRVSELWASPPSPVPSPTPSRPAWETGPRAETPPPAPPFEGPVPDGDVTWFAGTDDSAIWRLGRDGRVVKAATLALPQRGELVVAGRCGTASPAPATPSRSTPSPSPGQADAAARTFLRPTVGTSDTIDLLEGWESETAAAFKYTVTGAHGGGSIAFVYVVRKEDGSWPLFDVFHTQQYPGVFPGLKETLEFTSGCLNVRELPSTSAKVLECLGSGTSVEIDSHAPEYADGILWWRLVGGGWTSQTYLWCYGLDRPDC